MDWQNILASGVIAAFVTGILSIILKYTEQKHNSKNKYITEERQNWRKEIRNICEKLNCVKNKEDLQACLVELKVKINAFGNTDYYDEFYNTYKTPKTPDENSKDIPSCSSFKRLMRQLSKYFKKFLRFVQIKLHKNKDPMIQLTKYFKTDGHIWKQIHKIESNNKVNKKDISILIEYLSYLLKYDWERSKAEILTDRQVIYARLIFVLSVVFATGYIYLTSESERMLSNTFLVIMIFTLSFILSSLPKFDLFERVDYDLHKIKKTSGIPALFITIAIILLDLNGLIEIIIDKQLNNIRFVFIFPLVLLLISIALNCGTAVKSYSMDEQYRDLLLSFDKMYLNKQKSNQD